MVHFTLARPVTKAASAVANPSSIAVSLTKHIMNFH
jgi:hypothetical protein